MGSKMGKREKAVFLEEAEGKRASSKVSLSKMILRMVGILLGILAVGITVSALLSGYIRKQAEESIKSATEFYAGQMDTTFGDIIPGFLPTAKTGIHWQTPVPMMCIVRNLPILP